MTDNEYLSQALQQEQDQRMGNGVDLDETEEGDGTGMDEPEEAAPEMEEDEYKVGLSDIEELIGEATRLLEEVSALRGSITDIQIGGKNLTPDLSEYRGRMRTWKTKGYNVEGLESVLGTGNEELAKRVFQSFERDVKRLKEIEKSLDGLDTTGFKKKESDIRENLKDPERIIPTLKYLIELEIDIRRKMEMDV